MTLNSSKVRGFFTFDTSTLTFGTSTISPLYTYAPIKKDLSVKEKSLLVIPRGIEPLLPG